MIVRSESVVEAAAVPALLAAAGTALVAETFLEVPVSEARVPLEVADPLGAALPGPAALEALRVWEAAASVAVVAAVAAVEAAVALVAAVAAADEAAVAVAAAAADAGSGRNI